MKLSFSIRGWSGHTWEDFVEVAEEMRMRGIELHCAHGEPFSEKGGPFHRHNAAATRRQMFEKGLTLNCINTVCDIADEGKMAESLEELSRCTEMAKNLGVSYIRIHTMQKGEAATSAAHKFIEAALPVAEASDVTLILETIGAFSETGVLRDVLNTYASDHLAALWDLHSTYREGGETAELTIQNLGAYVRHVHIKDSVMEDNDARFCLLGEGNLPFNEFIDALASINYDEFISFEWNPA